MRWLKRTRIKFLAVGVVIAVAGYCFYPAIANGVSSVAGTLFSNCFT